MSCPDFAKFCIGLAELSIGGGKVQHSASGVGTSASAHTSTNMDNDEGRLRQPRRFHLRPRTLPETRTIRSRVYKHPSTFVTPFAPPYDNYAVAYNPEKLRPEIVHLGSLKLVKSVEYSDFWEVSKATTTFLEHLGFGSTPQNLHFVDGYLWGIDNKGGTIYRWGRGWGEDDDKIRIEHPRYLGQDDNARGIGYSGNSWDAIEPLSARAILAVSLSYNDRIFKVWDCDKAMRHVSHRRGCAETAFKYPKDVAGRVMVNDVTTAEIDGETYAAVSLYTHVGDRQGGIVIGRVAGESEYGEFLPAPSFFDEDTKISANATFVSVSSSKERDKGSESQQLLVCMYNGTRHDVSRSAISIVVPVSSDATLPSAQIPSGETGTETKPKSVQFQVAAEIDLGEGVSLSVSAAKQTRSSSSTLIGVPAQIETDNGSIQQRIFVMDFNAGTGRLENYFVDLPKNARRRPSRLLGIQKTQDGKLRVAIAVREEDKQRVVAYEVDMASAASTHTAEKNDASGETDAG